MYFLRGRRELFQRDSGCKGEDWRLGGRGVRVRGNGPGPTNSPGVPDSWTQTGPVSTVHGDCGGQTVPVRVGIQGLRDCESRYIRYSALPAEVTTR